MRTKILFFAVALLASLVIVQAVPSIQVNETNSTSIQTNDTGYIGHPILMKFLQNVYTLCRFAWKILLLVGAKTTSLIVKLAMVTSVGAAIIAGICSLTPLCMMFSGPANLYEPIIIGEYGLPLSYKMIDNRERIKVIQSAIAKYNGKNKKTNESAEKTESREKKI